MKLTILILISVIYISDTYAQNDFSSGNDSIFNDRGLVIKSRFGKIGENNFYGINEYEYYPNDSLKKITYNLPDRTLTLEYNINGHVISHFDEKDGEVTVNMTSEYTYLPSNKKSKVKNYDLLTEVETEDVYFYTALNEIDRIETLNIDDILISTVDYSYLDGGDLDRIVHRNEKNEMTKVEYYQYKEGFKNPDVYSFSSDATLDHVRGYFKIEADEKAIWLNASIKYLINGRISGIYFIYSKEDLKVSDEKLLHNENTYWVKSRYNNKGQLRKIAISAHSYHNYIMLKEEAIATNPMGKLFMNCMKLNDEFRKEYLAED